METDTTKPNARADPILPRNQIMCIEVMITEVSARDYVADAETTEVKAQAITSEEEVADSEPPVAQVPQWLEKLNNHRLKAGGFELRTESPDTRRLNDASRAQP